MTPESGEITINLEANFRPENVAFVATGYYKDYDPNAQFDINDTTNIRARLALQTLRFA